MNKLYIVGDSFGVPDKDYNITHWSELLSESLNWEVINLSKVCASNFHINQQIDLIEDASFVIMLCTSSLRTDVKYTDSDKNLIWFFAYFLHY